MGSRVQSPTAPVMASRKAEEAGEETAMTVRKYKRYVKPTTIDEAADSYCRAYIRWRFYPTDENKTLREQYRRDYDEFLDARDVARKKEIKMSEAPQYEHDCTRCEFLGRYSFEGPLADGKTEHIDSDLYYCPGTLMGGSILCRCSSDGPDYASMPLNLVIEHEARMTQQSATYTPGLLEALSRHRAKEKV